MTLIAITKQVNNGNLEEIIPILLIIVPIIIGIITFIAILTIFSINDKLKEVIRNQNDIENMHLEGLDKIIKNQYKIIELQEKIKENGEKED